MISNDERIKNAINWQRGLELVGGDEEVFVKLIGMFESSYFKAALRRIHDLVIQKNWFELRHEADCLHGSTAYSCTTNDFIANLYT